MNKQQRLTLISATKSLQLNGTVADFAAETGWSLSETASAVAALAGETGATLRVATSGVIVYQFRPGFERAYLLKGIKALGAKVVSATSKLTWKLFKLSFGVGLIVCIVLVVLVLIAGSSRSRSISGSRSGSSSSSGSSSGNSYVDFNFLFSIISDSWSGYSSKKGQEGDSNFFSACFSFVFGDGDPNEGFIDQQWSTVAAAIRAANGAVVWEQLAPYVSELKEEDDVLPLLIRFDGVPEVTNRGDIIYTFPELMESDSAVSEGDNSPRPPALLNEHEWRFSRASGGMLARVAALSSGTLVVALLLMAAGEAAGLMFGVSVYLGLFFVAIPLLRCVVLRLLNMRIRKRNSQRSSALELLRSSEIQGKLESSRQFALPMGIGEIVYTTDEDMLAQEIDQLQGR